MQQSMMGGKDDTPRTEVGDDAGIDMAGSPGG